MRVTGDTGAWLRTTMGALTLCGVPPEKHWAYTTNREPGEVPYPCPGERAIWGPAVVAVGYDDDKSIKNTRCDRTTEGALLIRNSWGAGWGQDGCGWLPYDYVRSGLALDFWSLLALEWVDTEQFGLARQG
jgi:C1A family cysteine protease